MSNLVGLCTFDEPSARLLLFDCVLLLGQCKTTVTPMLTHWSYNSIALSYGHIVWLAGAGGESVLGERGGESGQVAAHSGGKAMIMEGKMRHDATKFRLSPLEQLVTTDFIKKRVYRTANSTSFVIFLCRSRCLGRRLNRLQAQIYHGT